MNLLQKMVCVIIYPNKQKVTFKTTLLILRGVVVLLGPGGERV